MGNSSREQMISCILDGLDLFGLGRSVEAPVLFDEERQSSHGRDARGHLEGVPRVAGAREDVGARCDAACEVVDDVSLSS